MKRQALSLSASFILTGGIAVTIFGRGSVYNPFEVGGKGFANSGK